MSTNQFSVFQANPQDAFNCENPNYSALGKALASDFSFTCFLAMMQTASRGGEELVLAVLMLSCCRVGALQLTPNASWRRQEVFPTCQDRFPRYSAASLTFVRVASGVRSSAPAGLDPGRSPPLASRRHVSSALVPTAFPLYLHAASLTDVERLRCFGRTREHSVRMSLTLDEVGILPEVSPAPHHVGRSRTLTVAPSPPPPQVEITLQDVNDNPPLFPNDILDVSIEENVGDGFRIMQLTATDADEVIAPRLSLLSDSVSALPCARFPLHHFPNRRPGND